MAGKGRYATGACRLGMAALLTGAWLGLGGCATGPVPSSSQPPPQPIASQERFLQSLVDRNFLDPEAHYQLGEFYHREGLWDKSQYHLDLSINFAPGFRKAQVALVQLLLDKGDRQAADAAVDRFLRQLENAPTDMVDLGRVFANAGREQYALACYTEAGRVAPTSALAFKELGLYWRAHNDTAKARQYLMHSFDLDPSQPDVAETLGQMGVVVEVPRPQVPNPVTPQSPSK
jgi:tetratricopeptide (TPR) repeat protein